MRKLIAFLLVLLVLVAGAMGKATKRAEAQDGVIITPTSIYRLGGTGTTWNLVNSNDVDASPDGRYLAMLVTLTRPPLPGEPCKMLYPPPYPNAPCLVKGRALLVYDTEPEPDELIGYKAYPTSGLYPKAVKHRKLKGHDSFAVLEGSRLGFYNLLGQKQFQTQLPETFNDSNQLLEGYLDFEVAYPYPDGNPVLLVAGGVYNDNHSNGLIAAVQWVDEAYNPLTGLHSGNFVVTQSEILECDGIVIDVASEGNDSGTITSALICEEDVDYETVKETVMVVEGTPQDPIAVAIPNFIAYRDKAFCDYTEVDAQSAVAHSGGVTYYLSNEATSAGCRPFFVAIEPGQEPIQSVLFEDMLAGANIIGTVTKALKKKDGKIHGLFVAGNTYDDNGLAGGFVTAALGHTNRAADLTLRKDEMAEAFQFIAGVEFVGINVVYGRLHVKGKILVHSNSESIASVTAGNIISQPVGGPAGGTDVVTIEFNITESDNDDQAENDDDQGEDD